MRQRSLLYAIACLSVGIVLGACSSIKSLEIEGKKVDYKAASNKLPPLEIPPDLTRPGPDERFTVPEVKGSTTYSEYNRERSGQQERTSVNSGVLPAQDNVRVERQGNQRWLVVKGRPDQLWPVVKEFWQETGFVLNLDMPEAGVMETDWNENRARISDPGMIRSFLGKLLDQAYSTSERDKFRTRLETGAEPNTTEIYISHRGMEEVYTSSTQEQTKWQPRPPDPELEAEMLRRLMLRFGVQEARAKQEVTTATNKAAPRATLTKGGGVNTVGTLALHEQFDRAWRSVGLALDRVGFTVEDRDRSKGIYFVRYIDPQIDNKTPESQASWFSRLKLFGSSDPKKAEQFRIQVTDADSGAQVNVLNKEGVPETSDTARKILTLLYDQLK